MRDHLKYYKKHEKIPTIDISDFNQKALFKLRFNFYFKLGLTKSDFNNKSVLELCPGTGYNAYYLIKKCSLKSITLVDKNPYSIKVLKKNLTQSKIAKIIDEDILLFDTEKKFDYVMMENAIDAFGEDSKVFKKLVKFTKPGGTIVISFGDLFGMFATKLRYLYSLILIQKNKIENFNEQLVFLSDIFKNHLNYLSKYTRSSEKWVFDNILTVVWITRKRYFDYSKLEKLISNKILIRATAPLFAKNFIWYKKMSAKNHNDNFFHNYQKENINFIDFETRFEKNSKYLRPSIQKFYNAISSLKFNHKLDENKLHEIETELVKIEKILSKINPNNKVSLSLKEFIVVMRQFRNKTKINKKFKYFSKLWGISNQQVSLTKII